MAKVSRTIHALATRVRSLPDPRPILLRIVDRGRRFLASLPGRCLRLPGWFLSLPGRFWRLEWQLRILTALSLGAMLYVQLVMPTQWGAGDPLDHLRMARFIMGQPEGIWIAWRPPGMALFMILVGVTWAESFRGLILSYAAFAFALPLLAYSIIRRYDRNWAFLAGAFAVLSAWSTAYSRMLLPEQLFHFVHFVALAQIGAWFANPRNRLLPYTIALSLFVLNLVRPVAALYYWVFLACALLMVRRNVRHLALASVLVVSLNAAWSLADRWWGASIFPTVYAPTTPDQRAFGELYYSGGQYHFVEELPPHPVIDADDGIHSKRMREVVAEYVRKYPDVWMRGDNPELPYLLFGRFAERPQDLAEEVFRRPNFAYFNFLRMALYVELGQHGAEKLMRRVAREHGYVGWRGVLSYFRRYPTKLLVGGMPSFGGRNFLGLYYSAKIRQITGTHYWAVWPTTPKDVAMLDAGNGPASKEFLRAVELTIKAYPGYWEDTNQWFSRHKGKPDEFFAEIMDPKDPYDGGMYEGYYWEALMKYYGSAHADRLYMDVGLETLRKYPYSGTMILDNSMRIMFIRPFGVLKGTLEEPYYCFWGDLMFVSRENSSTGLSPELAAELIPKYSSTKAADRLAKAYALGHLTSPFWVIAAAIFLLPAMLTSARPLASFLVLAYLYNVAVIAVFGNFGAPRYYDVFMMLPVLGTCLGASAFFNLYAKAERLPA